MFSLGLEKKIVARVRKYELVAEVKEYTFWARAGKSKSKWYVCWNEVELYDTVQAVCNVNIINTKSKGYFLNKICIW